MPKTIRRLIPYLAAILLALITAISCQKELSGDIPGGPGVSKRTSVEGRVTDESGMPVQGATVKAGLNVTQTDKNGMFSIDNAAFTTSETFVTVIKSGYFKGTRTFFSRQNSNNFLKIQLLRKSISARIPAADGGDVSLSSDHGNIHFTPNSFVTPSGASYSGTVLVATQYIDPTLPSIAEQMPGDLRGVSSAGNVVGLKSYGMIGVELMDEAGMPLQLKPGSPAMISMTIPDAILGSSPATIPLWHFNDSTGLWKQEGSATRVGNSYEGQVSHFSFWNCDDPFEYVKLQAKVVNNAGGTVSGAKVQLTDNNGYSVYDYTDNNGMVDGFVPKNQTLEMKVYTTCGNVAQSSTIGPFNSDVNLGNILLTQSLITINGTVKSCTGSAVTDGYVQLIMDGISEFAAINNGSFSAAIISCQGITSVQVIAVDNAAQKQSMPVTVNITGNTVNAGELTACCVSSATFFSLNIGAQTFTANTSEYYRYGWKAVYDTLNPVPMADFGYAAYDSLINKYIYVGITLPANHVFTPGNISGELQMGYKGMTSSSEEIYLQPLGPGPHSMNFTEYGGLGQFISGSYSGQVQRETINNLGLSTIIDTVNATFNFRVRHITNPFP